MSKKTPEQMAATLAKALKIDEAEIKKAYEGDVKSLTEVFNIATQSKSMFKLKLASTGVIGAATAFSLSMVFMPATLVVGAACTALWGYSTYQEKEIGEIKTRTARMLVQARIDQKSGPK